jgi:hypothetical protein
VTNLNRRFESLKILVTLIALVVFLFSMLFPFYHIEFGGIEIIDQTFWSYRSYYSTFTMIFISRWSWFFNYWFDIDNLSFVGGLSMSWIPLTMFLMQALTLAFGCVSIVIKRRITLSVPLCLSSTVLALMSYVGYRLSSAFNDVFDVSQYQLGYYLVISSVVLFAFAFVLDEERTRRWKS